MKAKVYSVACAGKTLVLKAGGMAARRTAETTSLWREEEKQRGRDTERERERDTERDRERERHMD